jgi:outer membrane protein
MRLVVLSTVTLLGFGSASPTYARECPRVPAESWRPLPTSIHGSPARPASGQGRASSPGPAGATAPDSLTLDEAVRIVLETHPAVEEAREGVLVSSARVQGSRSSLYPVVDANGLYSHVGPVPSLEFQDRTISLFPSNNYNASVTVRQTVYDAGRREIEVERALSVEETAAEAVEVVRSGLAYQTIDAFNAILFLQENLAVQEEELQALTRHLAITEEKVRSGTATEFEVLTTQVRIADVESRRVEVASNLEVRRIELAQLLGWATDTPLMLLGSFDGPPPALDVDSLVGVALAQRPVMRLSKGAEGTAEVQARLASLGDKPSVSLNLTLGAKNGYVPHLNAVKPNWVAGMSLDFPLFNGHRTRSQVEESEAGLSQARARTRALERTVTTQVQQAAASVQASQEKIRASELQVRQAEAALELANTRYQAGVVTNLDVLDAQTSLSEARLMELRARYDLVRSRYLLMRTVGDWRW